MKFRKTIATTVAAAAHRLDAVLDRARQVHTRLVARTVAIAQRVKAFCTEQPPVLTPVE